MTPNTSQRRPGFSGEILKLPEIANRLRLSKNTIRALAAEGKIREYKLGGKTLRYVWEEVCADLGLFQEEAGK